MARTMTGYVTPVLVNHTPDTVQAAADKPLAFAEYVQQTLGVPWPTIRDMATLRRKIREFFDLYPDCDYRTLCRVVMFMRSRKRRVPRMWMVIDEFRKAWAAGQLPELDPGQRPDPSLDLKIADALTVEQDPVWRRRLLLAQDPNVKREVYALWQSESVS